MDYTPSGPETARSLVPSRLLAPQTLRRPGPPSAGLARFGAVLVACALAGAWVDVWDYDPAYQDPAEAPMVGPADVAAMGASGTRTLYLQAAGVARTVGPPEDPGQLGRFLVAAHARGVRVVGWYAPSLTDPEEDLARLLAVARFSAAGERFDGLAVGVEVNQNSPEDRSELLALSRRLRAEVGPSFPLALIVPPPATLEETASPFPTGAIGASVYDFRPTPAGIQRETGIASAGGFGDRELSE